MNAMTDGSCGGPDVLLESDVDDLKVGRDVFVRPSPYDLAELPRLVDAGQPSICVDEIVALDSAAEAHRRIERGDGRGKTVLEIG